MKITEPTDSAVITAVTAWPVSYAIPPAHQVALGIGRTVKRDAVLVRVDSDRGVCGWGEAHAARAPTAIAELVNTTLAQLVTGLDACRPQQAWDAVYRMQLRSHGAGAAAAIGLSGIDLALWDLRGRLEQRPVCALLGGRPQDIKAYAGGIALGFVPVATLVEEARGLVARGYRALKLRIGDRVDRDRERITAVRDALGDDIAILVDANTSYTLADVEAIAPTLSECAVDWLEEPFAPHAWRDYVTAAGLTDCPLAAGENHYTRFDFERLAADGAVRVWQPDLSKTGGITEVVEIARLAAASDARLHPHTSLTPLNVSASLNVLSALAGPGYFEADVSVYNPLREALGHAPFTTDNEGSWRPPERPGLGVEVPHDIATRFPVIRGAGYV